MTGISAGTLVIFLAYNGGLVAVSDTRQTLDGHTFCDGANKFIDLNAPDRTLLIVTGNRGLYRAEDAYFNDPCTYVRHNEREFDLGLIAKEYLEAVGLTVAATDMAALGIHCLKAIEAFRLAHPDRYAVGLVNPSTVVLASYDPATGIALVRSIDLGFDKNGLLKFQPKSDEQFTPDDWAQAFAVGEADYVRQQVIPTIRDGVLRSYLDAPVFVSEMTKEQAIEIASAFVEAASKRTDEVPAQSGIGGPLDVRVIDKEQKPSKVR